MKKKGFTLIELLGVIIVLAIIALIAVPTILGVIDKAKKGSLKNSAYGLIEAANLYYAQYGVSETEKFDLSGDNKLSYKGKVESGTVLLNSKGKVMICINDNGNAAYKNYNDNEVVVVSGKTCNVNTSETQVLLDGEKTINEYTNQELTDLVNSLQEQIQIQQQEITSLKQQVNNKTDNSSVATLTTKHNEDINIINNKIGTEDLTVISDGSISQILIDNNELVKNLQTALSSKVDQTVTNNLSSQLSSLSGTVNNHTTQISNLITSLNGVPITDKNIGNYDFSNIEYKLNAGTTSCFDTNINTAISDYYVHFVAGIASFKTTGNLYVRINAFDPNYDINLDNIGAGINATVIIDGIRVSAGWVLTIRIMDGQGKSVSKVVNLTGKEFNSVRIHSGASVILDNVSSMYQKMKA